MCNVSVKKMCFRKIISETEANSQSIIKSIKVLIDNALELGTDFNFHYKEINGCYQTIYKILNLAIGNKCYFTDLELNELSELFLILLSNIDDSNSADCIISLSLCILTFLKIENVSDNCLVHLFLENTNDLNTGNRLLSVVLRKIRETNFYISYSTGLLSVIPSDVLFTNTCFIELLNVVLSKRKLSFIGIYLKSIFFKKLSDILINNQYDSILKISEILMDYVLETQFIKQSAIRGNNKAIFKVALRIHQSDVCADCSRLKCCRFVELIANNILSQSWSNFSKYIYLSSFVKEYSDKFILNYEPKLIDILLESATEYSLWSYISELGLSLIYNSNEEFLQQLFLSKWNKIDKFICECFIPKLSVDAYKVLLESTVEYLKQNKMPNKSVIISVLYLLFLTKKKSVSKEYYTILVEFLYSKDIFCELIILKDESLKDNLLSILCKEIINTKGKSEVLWDNLFDFLENNVLGISNKLKNSIIKNLKSIFQLISHDKCVNSRYFVDNFMRFIVDNCYPGASFNKINLIINYFYIFITIMDGNFDDSRLKQNSGYLLKVLSCYMNDSFQENRILSSNLLIYLANKYDTENEFDISVLYEIANEKSSSSNPNDSLVGSQITFTILSLNNNCYTFKDFVTNIFDRLREDSDSIKSNKDIVVLSTRRPFYSSLFCLKELLIYNFEQFNTIVGFKNLLKVCESIYEYIFPVISSTAPEGSLPFDMDEMLLDSPTNYSEYLVVCCWKSCKEISDIFGELCSYLTKNEFQIDYDNSLNIIDYICQFFITNISLVTHKGAFQALTTGLKVISEAFWHSRSNIYKKYPFEMINSALSIIINKNNTFYTRRSAGLPHLFLALITSEPTVNKIKSSFGMVANTLIDMLPDLKPNDDEKDSSCTIHIFNILRLLFKESTLSFEVTSITFCSLKYSMMHFNSSIWSIRNSATLLFCAIVERIFGPPKSTTHTVRYNKINSKVFFNKYPGTYEFLKDFVAKYNDSSTSLQNSISVYPLFILLSRLIPECEDQYAPLYPLDNFREVALKYLATPVWKVRVAAARVFAALSLSRSDAVNQLLFGLSRSLPSQNLIHGIIKSISVLLTEDWNDELIEFDSTLILELSKLINDTWVVMGRFNGLHEQCLLELVDLTQTLCNRSKALMNNFNNQPFIFVFIDRYFSTNSAINLVESGHIRLLSILFCRMSTDQIVELIVKILAGTPYQIEKMLQQLQSNSKLFDTFIVSPAAIDNLLNLLNNSVANLNNQSILQLLLPIFERLVEIGCQDQNLDHIYNCLRATSKAAEPIRTDTCCKILVLMKTVVIRKKIICDNTNVGGVFDVSNIDSWTYLIDLLVQYCYYENMELLRLTCAKCLFDLFKVMSTNELRQLGVLSKAVKLVLIGLNDDISDIRDWSSRTINQIQLEDFDQYLTPGYVRPDKLKVFLSWLDLENSCLFDWIVNVRLGYKSPPHTSGQSSNAVGVFEAEEVNCYYDVVDVLVNYYCCYRNEHERQPLSRTEIMERGRMFVSNYSELRDICGNYHERTTKFVSRFYQSLLSTMLEN